MCTMSRVFIPERMTFISRSYSVSAEYGNMVDCIETEPAPQAPPEPPPSRYGAGKALLAFLVYFLGSLFGGLFGGVILNCRA